MKPAVSYFIYIVKFTGLFIDNKLSDENKKKEFKEYILNKKYDIEDKNFNENELWNLDTSIIEFILPRLVAFRETTKSYPENLTEDEYNQILDKIIYGFILHLEDVNDDHEDQFGCAMDKEEAFILFGKYLPTLWI